MLKVLLSYFLSWSGNTMGHLEEWSQTKAHSLSLLCELYKLLGIKLAMSTAYHPQTNGQTEHVNQVLEGYLHIFTSR
jgi:hypothetical protein